ncbi:RNA 2'-phosphotransferase [Sphingomonas sp.]|uniref:RNA 2'-phosphotransferase n=1 Tax=Sphingomonas sp. TaxID=28214 RepID=UPI001B2AB47C|nr:RNA 2'-phosphotransferase [Sphingomonas sp.]MBO9711360.1 RNA 2'-phosphotransferase [Sphingomonas sp.]
MSKELSKTLSYWLRHAPEAGGLVLDDAGWAPVNDVMAALGRERLTDRIEDLRRTVAESDKSRFELSDDGAWIRARQGHSVAVDLDWPVTEPPEFLFHGTVERFLDAILGEGLKPMARHHVHLSPDVATATRVGERRGAPVILRVAAGAMARGGAVFRLSSNGVWLADAVPPEFIERV